MKRPYLLLLVVLVSFAGCQAIRGLSGQLEYPNVEFDKMRFETLSFDGVTMRFDFDVENKNRVDIKTDGYTYVFKIDGNTFIEGTSAQGIDLKSRSSSTVSIPLTFSFSELSRAVSSVVTQDSIEYEIALVFSITMPVGGIREVPAQTTRFLPVPRLPKLSLENVSIAGFSFTGADVRVLMKFENPNNFALKFSDILYNLEVDGSRWISTTLNQVVDLAAKSSSIVEVPIRLEFSQIGSSVYRIIANRNPFDYRVSGNGSVDVDLPYFDKTSRLPFDISGTHQF